MTLCAPLMSLELERRIELPAHAGPARFGRFLAPEPLFMIEPLAGKARVGVSTQRGFVSERSRAGERACHRDTMVRHRRRPVNQIYRRPRLPRSHPLVRSGGASRRGEIVKSCGWGFGCGVLPDFSFGDYLLVFGLAGAGGASWSGVSRSATATGSSQHGHSPPGPIRRHHVLQSWQRCSPR